MARMKMAPKKRIENASTAKDVSSKGSTKQSKWRKEIIRYQKATHCLIPKLPFSRLVKHIILELVSKHNYFSDHGHTTFRVTKGFLECLQEASEAYLTFFFVDLNYPAIHANRETVLCKDIALIKRVKREAYQLLK